MKMFHLSLGTALLGLCGLSLAVGFDFTKCGEGLADMALGFESSVAANMPHLKTAAERSEMARRMARYGVVRERAAAVKQEAQWVYGLSQVADKAFETAMALDQGPEQNQVASARARVAQLLRENLPRAAEEAALQDGAGTPESNRRNMEQSLGPLDKIDGAHLRAVSLVSAEALILSETRRLFLKKLIGLASHKQNLDQATPMDKAQGLAYANSELKTVVNAKLLDAVSRDNLNTESLADPIAEAQSLLQSPALPDFHRQELEANIKFYVEFGLPTVPTFTSYVNGLKKIVLHNSTP